MWETRTDRTKALVYKRLKEVVDALGDESSKLSRVKVIVSELRTDKMTLESHRFVPRIPRRDFSLFRSHVSSNICICL
jgi:predicted metal-dependent enzyme (double-stranded beta helix superfamily)